MNRLRISDVIDEPLRMLPPIAGYEKMPLISLADAIKPLMDDVPDIEQYALEAKNHSKNSSEDILSIDELAAIYLYTMDWNPREKCFYYLLNARLRSKDRSTLKVWFPYLKLFITALLKIKPVPRRLFRGTNRNLSQDYSKDNIIVWWAFSSCTTSEIVAKSFCGKSEESTIFEIDCYSGRCLSIYSAYANEEEVLLIAATQFRIVSKTKNQAGSIVIHLKEIEPKYPLIQKGSTVYHPSVVHPPKEPTAIPKRSYNIPEVVQPDCPRTPDIAHQVRQIRHRSKAVIEGQRLNREDMKDVVEAILLQKQCPTLEIRHCQLASESILELGKGICASIFLTELDLSSCNLSSNDVSNLVAELSIAGKHRIELWRCCCFSRMKTLHGAPIKTLRLSQNRIDDDGMKHIATLIQSRPMLTTLYLDGNRIQDLGVEILTKTLSSRLVQLEKLYLHENKRITDRSVTDLIDMLQKNHSLKTLWLIGCNFSVNKREELINAVKTKKGFFLNLERYNE